MLLTWLTTHSVGMYMQQLAKKTIGKLAVFAVKCLRPAAVVAFAEDLG